MEYIIYCDESNSSGPKFGDFFGGCIVNSRDWRPITEMLETKKKELNLFGELKWTKVTAQYLDRYIEIVDLFFDFVRDGRLKSVSCSETMKINHPVQPHGVVMTNILSCIISS